MAKSLVVPPDGSPTFDASLGSTLSDGRAAALRSDRTTGMAGLGGDGHGHCHHMGHLVDNSFMATARTIREINQGCGCVDAFGCYLLESQRQALTLCAESPISLSKLCYRLP